MYENNPASTIKKKIAMVSLIIIALIIPFAVAGWILQSQNFTRTEAQGQEENLNLPRSQEFVGSIHNRVYHYPSCPYAYRITMKGGEDTVWFDSPTDAKTHGYRPCEFCLPP